MSLLPYRPRWLNRAYAFCGGYFWIPCPICGREFGGHEMRVFGHTLWGSDRSGRCTCPKCPVLGPTP